MLATLLSQLVIAHSQTPGWAWAVVLALLVCAGACGWSLRRGKVHSARAVALTESLSAAHAEIKALTAKESELNRRLEEKRSEVTTLKKDLAGQKKKTHAKQEELMALRQEVTDAHESFAAAQNTRPAFEEPVPVERPVAQPPPPPPSQDAALQQLRERTDALDAENASLQQERAVAQQEFQALRQETRELARRLEDYRRIDIISKNKLELLEDKLRHMGTQYYDAVSELAHLRGEVPNLVAATRLPGADSPTESVPS